ncbi:MAG: hypothetical protein ABIH74_05715 [Candidatus Omnitrophota bacterium]
MSTRRFGKVMKSITVLIVIVFAGMNPVPLYGQMATPAGTTVVEKESEQPLPASGNVTVNFKDVDIMTVLHYLSEVSGVDIIPSPGVEGMVTMRLRNKPWETALDIVTRNSGYVYLRDDKQDIIRVMPKTQLQGEEPVTEVIPINHIMREVELTKGTTSGEDITVAEKEESIIQLMAAVNSIIDIEKGEKATFVQSANAIVVTAIPARIIEVKNMIARIDKKTPQILLDTKIIEIELEDDERFGVDWTAIISASMAKRPTTFPFERSGVFGFLPGGQRKFFPYMSNIAETAIEQSSDFPYLTPAPTITSTTTLNYAAPFTYGSLDFSTFNATMSFLDERTNTETLSSPRITTLNNQKAMIKVVEKVMLQKTQETTQTAGIVTVEFEEEAEAREAGVKLTVIPHVNENGDISVNLFPEVSTNSGFSTQAVAGGTLSTVSLTFLSREASTTIRARDGETIFIGGLISRKVEREDNKVPILGDIFQHVPFMGHLFRYESEDATRTEIVFFITVHLVKEAMDSVTAGQMTAEYDKYIGKSQNNSDEIIRRWENFEAQKVPWEDKNPFKDKKEGYKPLMDFRKEGKPAGEKKEEAKSGEK